ncbi:hypothetical protein SH580_03215 [Coraliomargarita algicola]|uniref:Uncharacterized protein n=1 Tax=Coraliomargarita algicola TaxID=3092156 RepID=A0ABZ0RNN9_9BACT|nr:hypothetical protein [Coraliomargarita sp. J2-16]WPJ96713.1 hypothetical protein SH580_03215 [Coraliomargarita sp. J2-16]
MITHYISSVPEVREGFGLTINHYNSGRISAALAGHGGICALNYYGQQRIEDRDFFKGSETSAFNKLFRIQVVLDGLAYFPEFKRTRHLPFGYQSECELAGVRLRHDLVLDENVLFQRVTVLSNPEKLSVRARLLFHDHLWAPVAGRSHTTWEIDSAGRFQSIVTDQASGEAVETRIVVGSSRAVRSESRHGTFMNYMESLEAAESTVFYVAFNPSVAVDADCEARMDAKLSEYAQELAEGIRFDTGNPTLDSALNNCAPMVKALCIGDRPGAIKASQSYWVWGWDSMVHAEAYLWSGHTQIVRDMLDFYRDTADPVHGVAHAMESDFSLKHSMAPSAQCLYTVMLYNYFAATGDEATLNKHLPFAKEIVARAGEACSKHSRLSTGLGFYPDHPQMLGHTPEDVSMINNSLYLQALQALESLTGEYTELCAQVQGDMETILWDDEVGYWLDSVGEADQDPRKYYPLYGQLYVSPFGAVPKATEIPRMSRFLREHFLFEQGIYMFPPTMPGFMADGNQLGAYYPSVDRYYWNLMNQSGCRDAIEDFEQIVTYFWKEHSYPEGLTHETVNADPATDNPGGKQAFAAKAWFCDAIELHLGLRVYLNGFSLNPLAGERPFRLHNFVLRGKRIHFESLGNGAQARIRLNGQLLESELIPWERLSEDNTLRIEFED